MTAEVLHLEAAYWTRFVVGSFANGYKNVLGAPVGRWNVIESTLPLGSFALGYR